MADILDAAQTNQPASPLGGTIPADNANPPPEPVPEPPAISASSDIPTPPPPPPVMDVSTNVPEPPPVPPEPSSSSDNLVVPPPATEPQPPVSEEIKPPASNKPKKGVSAGVIITAVILLLVTLPLVGLTIKNNTEIRSRAAFTSGSGVGGTVKTGGRTSGLSTTGSSGAGTTSGTTGGTKGGTTKTGLGSGGAGVSGTADLSGSSGTTLQTTGTAVGGTSGGASISIGTSNAGISIGTGGVSVSLGGNSVGIGSGPGSTGVGGTSGSLAKSGAESVAKGTPIPLPDRTGSAITKPPKCYNCLEGKCVAWDPNGPYPGDCQGAPAVKSVADLPCDVVGTSQGVGGNTAGVSGVACFPKATIPPSYQPPSGGGGNGGNGGETPVTPTTPPQCVSIRVYDPAGTTALTSGDLAAMHPGSVITLGFTPPGNATKVRFQVNTEGWNETTTKVGSEFRWPYTLADTTSFSITAQWFDGANWN